MAEMIETSPRRNVTVRRTAASLNSAAPHISFAMPAYNEEENIERTVNECRAAFENAGLGMVPVSASGNGAKWGEIVVTNDCSKDSTADILARLQESMPNLVVVTHLQRNLGYGRALSDAIAATRGEWVATIDSDGQFDPGDLPSLLEKAGEGVDCVAGYRMKKKDSPLRVIADRGLNMIVRTLFGVPHRDTNCAFKLIRGDVIRGLTIETNGFQTPTEIVLKLNALGYRLAEAGVSHRAREEGKSKLKVVKTSLEFLRFLFYLRGKINLYRRGILARL
jgi:dolichol-phosphate mannosyltransferase